jgi:hypothetical protein
VITLGSRCERVAIADLNGDGKADIVATGTAAACVYVLLQDPASPGSFLSATSYSVGTAPNDIAVADFNKDGKPDIVVADYTSNDVEILLQDPANPGVFLAATSYPGHGTVNSMAIGDIDGDGHVDVVVANRTTNDISVFYGKGDGTLLPRVDLPAGDQPWDVKIADLNGDGAPDLVVVNFGGPFGNPDTDSSVMTLIQDPKNRRTFVSCGRVSSDT